ncbi:MAG: hypothetical protein BWZ10_01248 [candidate division BRC1 bacterium ADurb.BinA364]|nr:MAG: hypothetical protein BWZ10_01248 [candidate division BRC1 bacterium ADurb.BinA364]
MARGDGRQGLGGRGPSFSIAVAAFGIAMSAVASVEHGVQLAAVDERRIGGAAAGHRAKNRLGCREPYRGQTRRRLPAPRLLDALARRASAVIAHAIDQQSVRASGALGHERDSFQRRAGQGAAVFGVRHGALVEGPYARASGPFPLEQRSRFGAAAHEVIVSATAVRQDVRHRRAVAKGIRLPADDRSFSKSLAEIALAIEEVARVRFGGNQVGVALAHSPAEQFPPPLRDAPADALEHIREIALGGHVKRRRGLREDEVIVLVHEFQRLSEGSAALVQAFGPGPFPLKIEMRVADQRAAESAGEGLQPDERLGQPTRHRVQSLAGRWRAGRGALAFGDQSLDSGQSVALLRGGRRMRTHQSIQQGGLEFEKSQRIRAPLEIDHSADQAAQIGAIGNKRALDGLHDGMGGIAAGPWRLQRRGRAVEIDWNCAPVGAPHHDVVEKHGIAPRQIALEHKRPGTGLIARDAVERSAAAIPAPIRRRQFGGRMDRQTEIVLDPLVVHVAQRLALAHCRVDGALRRRAGAFDENVVFQRVSWLNTHAPLAEALVNMEIACPQRKAFARIHQAGVLHRARRRRSGQTEDHEGAEESQKTKSQAGATPIRGHWQPLLSGSAGASPWRNENPAAVFAWRRRRAPRCGSAAALRGLRIGQNAIGHPRALVLSTLCLIIPSIEKSLAGSACRNGFWSRETRNSPLEPGGDSLPQQGGGHIRSNLGPRTHLDEAVFLGRE